MNRVSAYLNDVADLLASKAAMASHSAHRPTIGHNREEPLVAFLNRHLPSRLRAQLGGTVVAVSGEESHQIDALVTNDLGLRFEENHLPFVMTEAVAAAVSVKSTLDRRELKDSLEGLLSIPRPSPEVLTFPLLVNDPFSAFVASHPTLWVFAYGGVQPDTCLAHLKDLVDELKISRHILGRLCVLVNREYTISYHLTSTTTHIGDRIPADTFHVSKLEVGTQGYPLARLVNQVTNYADWLNHMSMSVSEYFDTKPATAST